MTPLPVCKWRGDSPSPGKVACKSPLLIIRGGAVSEDFCRDCPCPDKDAAQVSPRRRPLPARPLCRHLGPHTGESRPCLTCGGSVAVPLHSCGLHGDCSLSKLLPQVACCRLCKDYDPCTDSTPSPKSTSPP